MTREKPFQETASIAQHVAWGVRLWGSEPAPGCMAFGELHNLSVFFDKMEIIRAFILKSSCREQIRQLSTLSEGVLASLWAWFPYLETGNWESGLCPISQDPLGLTQPLPLREMEPSFLL